jgi:hypothetical protein
MKILKSLALVLVLFSFTSAYAGNPADETAVKQIITSYLNGIDTRNFDIVEQSLYSEATVVTVNTISNKTNSLTADEMITQLKKGALGGWKREVNFTNLDVNEKTAMAKVEISDVKIKQTSYVSLVNDNGNWKIVSEVAIISRNGQ